MLWFSNLVVCVLVLVVMLMGVAFFTLLERKVLGYIHLRRGPNKVGYSGILQPFGDGLKLMVKSPVNPDQANNVLFWLSPMLGLFLSFILLYIYPGMLQLINFSYSVLLFLSLSALGVYAIMGSGWTSNSKYALLGSYRAIAQFISYEVSLSFILLSVLVEYGGFNWSTFMSNTMSGDWVLILPLVGWWMSVGLAETNRSPYDLAEGESELVSGFNIEYGGGGFALIFITEYLNILMLSMFSSLLFFEGSWLLFILWLGFYVWVRGTFPRMRYDQLMQMAWASYLPCSIMYLMYFSGVILFLGVLV